MTTLQLRDINAAPWGAPLLQDINLELSAGQVLGLAGPNGTGKSSLLRLIAGDIVPDTGELLIDGRTPGQWPRLQLARHRAYLPQLSLLNFPYTVEEVVALGRMPHATGAAEDRRIVAEALAMMDITALRERLYTRLSGGERQRVQLARVLAQILGSDGEAGGLLLLDEPTTALDLAHQQLVVNAVSTLAQRGCAIVLVIHDLNLVATMANRIALMLDGRLAACGPPGEVLTETLIRQVFAIDVLIQRHPRRDQPLLISR